jgi:hypothetical protein
VHSSGSIYKCSNGKYYLSKSNSKESWERNGMCTGEIFLDTSTGFPWQWRSNQVVATAAATATVAPAEADAFASSTVKCGSADTLWGEGAC